MAEGCSAAWGVQAGLDQFGLDQPRSLISYERDVVNEMENVPILTGREVHSSLLLACPPSKKTAKTIELASNLKLDGATPHT